MLKKSICIIMSAAILLGATILQPALSVSAAGTTKTLEQALAWLNSMVGQYIDADGAYGAQCVDLVVAYYDFLGVPRSSGNAKDYATNWLPEGFTRIQGATPQAGDILVYSGGEGIYAAGHVAIFESTYVTYHQRFNSHNYVDRVTTIAYNGFTTTPYWGVIRPNFAPSHWYNAYSAVNAGDNFYASIIKDDAGIPIVSNNQNVELAGGDTSDSYAHIWNFVRQDDGSYVIYNCADKNVLNVAGSQTAEATNVDTAPYAQQDAQKWYIYKIGENQYAFKPKLCDLVLDVSANSNEAGTNIFIYGFNGSGAQLFRIDKLPAATEPTLNVTAGDYRTLTKFTFASDDSTLHYNLVIKSGTKGNVTDYTTIPNIQNSEFMYELPAGYYEVYAEASNGYATTVGDVIAFKVAGKPTEGGDGWTYSDKLYSEITSDKYEIEYQSTHDVVAAVAPDESYTKGEYVKTEFVNSGEPYWSEIELATSDTLVLIDYYYYHYCGGNTGANANYIASGSYVHFDSLPKDNVYVHSSNTDYDNSQYIYYHLKFTDGSDAYCNSNVSCDGAFGSHGNRSCYWYKNSQYQNRVATDLYRFSKSGEWQSTPDADAAEVTYRYKLKENTAPSTPEPSDPITPIFTLGDVNRDGKVNIRDATAIQKYIAKMITADEIDLLAADITLDSKINIKDATTIQKKIAGLI